MATAAMHRPVSEYINFMTIVRTCSQHALASLRFVNVYIYQNIARDYATSRQLFRRLRDVGVIHRQNSGCTTIFL